MEECCVLGHEKEQQNNEGLDLNLKEFKGW